MSIYFSLSLSGLLCTNTCLETGARSEMDPSKCQAFSYSGGEKDGEAE